MNTAGRYALIQKQHAHIRDIAATIYKGGGTDPDVEIDEDAEVLKADDGSGAYVQAWLWVDASNYERND